MNPVRDPLFCYSLAVGGREFAIQVSHDGIILWDDYQERREALARTGGLPAWSGGVLALEADEFTVSFKLSPRLLVHVREAARLFAEDKWTTEHEHELDGALVPLFWKRVNARLVHPLPRTGAASHKPRRRSGSQSSS
jgi:hypothetical protein